MEKIKLNFHLKKNDDEKKTVLLRYRFLDLKEKSISISFLKFAEEEWLDKSTCKKFGYLMGKNDMFNRPENKAKFSEEILLLKDIRDKILYYVNTLTYDYSFEPEILKNIVEAHNPNREIEDEKPKNLLDLIQFEINYHKNLGDISDGQISNYGDLYNSLLEFKDSVFFNKLSLNIIEFKPIIFHMYEDFLINKGCVNSSIRTYLKNFLAICNKISKKMDVNLDTTLR